MKTWFVTGTDTDVGKTVVTACLAAAAPGRVVAIKAVASGVDDGAGVDATRIGDAAGHAPRVFTTYAPPLSPHRAALLEDRPVDVEAMLQWLDDVDADTRIVEGVGGWRVPLRLSPRFEVRDLAQHLAAPVIVVAADRLGVLNHTILTVEAVRRAGLNVAGVVLNRWEHDENDPSPAHNLDDLRALLDVPIMLMGRIDLDSRHALRAAGDRFWSHVC